jgi:hypothetical protein
MFMTTLNNLFAKLWACVGKVSVVFPPQMRSVKIKKNKGNDSMESAALTANLNFFKNIKSDADVFSF